MASSLAALLVLCFGAVTPSICSAYRVGETTRPFIRPLALKYLKAGAYQQGTQRNICLADDLQQPLEKNLAAFANAVSNDVLNKMITGYGPALSTLKSDFPVLQQEATSLFERTLRYANASAAYNEKNLLQVQSYLRRMQDIVKGKWTLERKIGGPYDDASSRVLTALRRVHYDPAKGGIADKDLCLSLQDKLNTPSEYYESDQQRLNKVSNSVARAMKHCDLGARMSLADSIEFNMGHRGTYAPETGQRPQACYYVQALLSLLREGGKDTLSRITYGGPASSDKPGTSNIADYIPGAHRNFKPVSRLRLVEPYRTVYFRVLLASEPDANEFNQAQ